MAGSRRLTIEITGDSRDAQRAFADVDSSARSVGDRLAGLGQIAAVGAAAIVTGLGAAATAGITAAADLQQVEIGFTTILGSGEAAREFMGELQQFAATTPFEFSELSGAASRLTAVGVESARVIPLMTSLGDATSAMGTGAEGIDRAVTALTQMEQKGKVTAEEMMQLTEAGIPAWEALATVLGTDVAGAQAQVSAGTVQAEQMFIALETNAGAAMQRLSGGMAAQAQSWSGMVSNLRDTITFGLASSMQGALTEMTAQMPQITGVIGSIITELGPHLSELATGAMSLLGTLLPALAPIVSMVAQLAAAFMDALGPALVALAPWVERVASQVGNALMEAFDDIAPVLPVVAEAIGMVANYLAGWLGEALTTVVPLISGLLQAIAPLIPVVLRLADIAFQALVSAIEPIIPVIVQVVEEVVAALIPAVESLAPMIEEQAGLFGEMVTALVPMIPAIGDLLIALIPLIPPFIELSLIFLELTPLLIPIIDALVQLAVLVIDRVIPAIDDLAGSFVGPKQAIEDFKTAATRIFDEVVGFITGLPERISDAATGLFDGIKDAFSSAINWIINAWNRLDFGIHISVPGWVPGVGGRGFDVDDIFPDIPTLHSGGRVNFGAAGEGLALLRNDEVVVTPEQQTRGTVENHFHFHGPVSSQNEMERMVVASLESARRKGLVGAGNR